MKTENNSIGQAGEASAKIVLGKYSASLINPPNEGTVTEGATQWNIGRNYAGMIVLRSPDKTQCHPDFMDGMYMAEFCQWINSKL